MTNLTSVRFITQIKFLLTFMLIALSFSSLSNDWKIETNRSCSLMTNLGDKINCQKISEVNRKLKTIIQHLRLNNFGDDGYQMEIEYTCKTTERIKIEGHGTTINEAMNDLNNRCKEGWSKSYCASLTKDCNYNEVRRMDHFTCGIGKFRGLGQTKKEAMKQALKMCLGYYPNKHYCLSRFKGCDQKN